MSPPDPRARQIAALTGRDVRDIRPLQGGDLSEVVLVRFADDPPLVCKRGPRVRAEAAMLAALAPYAPEVRHQQGDLLLLPYLPPARPTESHWRALGQQLRRLHSRPGTGIGWPEEYGFGPLRIDNPPCPSWPAFYGAARLAPFLGDLPADLSRALERLITQLPDRLPEAPPRLLHGDLWQGNLHFSGASAYLIDPACYYGDPEVDLAMLTLFGSPPDSFWQGYGPLRKGWQARRPIYQLWPALVHLHLFGAGYRPLLRQLLSEVER